MMSADLKVPLHPEEISTRKVQVCVTGATGFVAGPLIQRLLAIGHTVHATVRNPEDDSKVGHLKALPNAKTNLKLFKGDLLEEGSFDEAIQGCEIVFHTASPYIVSVPKGKEKAAVLDPALKGTENIIGSVNRAQTVRKVVLTSSVAALYGDPHERGDGHRFNDSDWSINTSETFLPYYYSKKIAEKRAWELAEQQTRWKLVTVLPGQVWGPPLAKRANSESVKMMQQMLTGKNWPAAPPIGMGFVDVRDVALVHSLAAIRPDATGRYIAVSTSMNFLEMAAILRKRFPQYWLPFLRAPYYFIYLAGPVFGLPRDMIKTHYGKYPLFDTTKAQKELNVKFLDAETLICDEAERLIELKMV